jgi:hypothetical protein
MMLAKTLALKSDDKEIPAIGITPCHCMILVKHTLAVEEKKNQDTLLHKVRYPRNGYRFLVYPLSVANHIARKQTCKWNWTPILFIISTTGQNKIF